MSDWGTNEMEQAIKVNFKRLAAGFQQLEELDDIRKQIFLKELTVIMQDCKRQIKDFERDARTDGMPPKILSEKKRQLVQELNAYIACKKATAASLQARSNLIEASSDKNKQKIENMRNETLIEMGRKDIKDTDEALERARRVVEDTIQIGAQAAATLNDQTKQMEGILNDLDDITFNMKKAKQIIAEITRGFITDKCILCLCCMIVIGAVIGVSVSVAVIPAGALVAVPTPGPLPGQIIPVPGQSSNSTNISPPSLEIFFPEGNRARKLLGLATQGLLAGGSRQRG